MRKQTPGGGPPNTLKFRLNRAKRSGSKPLLAGSVWVVLLACAQGAWSADPYGAALDKRFSTSAAPAPEDPAVAKLEEGIKQQAREHSQRQEADTAEGADGIEQLFLWGIGLTVLLSSGLVALIGLRRWNRWLDAKAAKRERSRNAIVEDPLMAEFLRTLHEDLQAGPLAPAGIKASTGGAVPLTAEDKAISVLDPLGQGALLNENVALLRADFQNMSKAPDDAERLRLLGGLVQRLDLVKQGSVVPQLRSVRLLASALHGLLKQLSTKAGNITASALRTAASAVDLLELLCKRACRPDLATAPPVRLLAVDDDAISLRAVSMALKKAFNDPDMAAEGQSALELAARYPYDVIFLDVEMPGMNGFELCSKIHETGLNRTTPIVFVTSHSDFDSRAKSVLVGAHDLIGKPFLAFEITVKALTLVLKAREAREAQGRSLLAGAAGPSTRALQPAGA